MESEEWRVVPDSGEFEVSTLGRVRDNRGHILKTWIEDGAVWVHASEREFGFRGPVWKLVLAGFYRGTLGNVLPVFLDGDPKNLSIDNLQWDYLHVKSGEMRRIGLKGDAYPLTLDRRLGPRIEIIETGQTFDSYADCAKAIGGDLSNVRKAVNGYLKSHQGFTFRHI